MPDASVGGSDLEEDQVVKEAGSGIDSKDGVDEADCSDVAVDEAEAVAGVGETEAAADAEDEAKADAEEEAEEAEDVGQTIGENTATEDDADEEDTEQQGVPHAAAEPVEVEGRGAHTSAGAPAGEQGDDQREASNAGAVDESDGAAGPSVSATGQADPALGVDRGRERSLRGQNSHPESPRKKNEPIKEPTDTSANSDADQELGRTTPRHFDPGSGCCQQVAVAAARERRGFSKPFPPDRRGCADAGLCPRSRTPYEIEESGSHDCGRPALRQCHGR